MKKLFIITGEYSGDKHAADVVSELRKINSDIEIEAIGGQNLENLGVKLFSNHAKMSAMGISLDVILDHINLGKNLARYLKDEYKPDMVLLIDYGGFNLNLSKVLSKYGIKIYYYIPPQIWASRKWRLNTVKKCINKVLTIFPFERKMYESVGVDVDFVGHPLLNQIPKAIDKQNLCNDLDLDCNREIVSIFPGSRVFEIKNLLEIFLKSASLIKKEKEDVQFLLAQAPTIKDELILPLIEKYKDLNIKVVKNKNYDLLSASDALILASGTVALEAALYETPMIISYKGPWILYLIYLLVRSIKRVSLPNIIMDKEIIPELVQMKAKPNIIAGNILKILNNDEYRRNMIEELSNVKQSLNVSGTAKKVASIINSDI